MSNPSVLVVGAGISGLAAAHALLDRGATVTVVDRGEVVGGRLAVRQIGGRVADTGASYFTSPSESGLKPVVDDWLERGLARPWTDTFRVAGPNGLGEAKTGPMRFAAPAGLRSLAVDLAEKAAARGATVRSGVQIARVTSDDRGVDADGDRFDAVVLAMPDPQARRLLDPPVADELFPEDAHWESVLAVVVSWPERWWPMDLHGAFVQDSPELSFIADDGDRRGDGAPVLVLHTTDALAWRHLDDPQTAVAPAVHAAVEALGGAPEHADRVVDTIVHRWTLAKPTSPRSAPFRFIDGMGICGDAWGGKSSVSAAWASGAALGRALPLG